MATLSLYPESPPDVPANLATPSSRYQLQTFLVLLALGMFVLLYFGLMFFCLIFAVWAVFLCPYEGGIWIYVKLASMLMIIPLGVLFIFLFKNLFKFERARKEFLIEIFEDEHPRLFDFIHQVCDETGAPYPKHVYLDYAVNAAAIPDTTSFFHLFLPTGKSLLIGLGLVNACNLTEFKAMLAHEFGHFSQKGMKIGSYIYTSLRIIDHVVNGRDWFDNLINLWSKADLRISWPAWIVMGILWVLRKILGMMLFVVYFFHLALKRQMEFNADLVAVSVTGSDAPVHLLYRCYFADACFNQAVGDLKVAMDHHLYTSNLFHHQAAARRILRVHKKDPTFGDPPDLPPDPEETTQVFEEDDDKIAQMWSTHPPGHDREQNAKSYYIRSDFDERSPWLLFDNVDELCERVTYKFYRYYFKIPKDVILAEAEEVQGFIDDEHGDRTYDPKYQGLYDCRNIQLKGIKEIAKECAANPWSHEELSNAYSTLYNAEVKHRSQLYYKRKEEERLMTAIVNGWHKPKDDEVKFRGETHDTDSAKKLLKKVEKELLQDYQWIATFDRKVYTIFFQMALHIDRAVAAELFLRYEFHLDLQNMWYELQKQNEPIGTAIDFLNNNQSNTIQAHNFRDLVDTFRETHKTMREMLKAAKSMKLPALKNLPVGQSLRPYILNDDLIESLSKRDSSLSLSWIIEFLGQFRQMKDKVDRIHFKSLAGILALQERIGKECLHRWSKKPAAKAAVAAK